MIEFAQKLEELSQVSNAVLTPHLNAELVHGRRRKGYGWNYDFVLEPLSEEVLANRKLWCLRQYNVIANSLSNAVLGATHG